MKRFSIIENFKIPENINNNKNIKRYSTPNNNLLLFKLPNVQKIINKPKNDEKKINIPVLSTERTSTKYHSDISFDNSMNSNNSNNISFDLHLGYKSSSNSKLPKMKNDDYFSIYQKRRMTRNILIKNNKFKEFFNDNSNSTIQKKNRTIINIYNTSVRNSPKIFLLSSFNSNSFQNNSNKNYNNLSNNVKRKDKKLSSIKNQRQNNTNFSLDILKNAQRRNTDVTRITLKKHLKLNLKGKKLIDYNNQKQIKSSSSKDNKNKENIEKFIEEEKQKNFKDGPDYNEEIRNKFIKKNIKEKDEIELNKLKLELSQKIKKNIKTNYQSIIIEKTKKEEEKDIKLILNTYYSEIMNNEESIKNLKKFENYLIKTIKRKKNLLINTIPEKMPEILIKIYFEYDIYPYMVKTLFKIRQHNYIKLYCYKSIKALEKQRQDLEHQENFYFLLERFIKNDIILEPEENISFHPVPVFRKISNNNYYLSKSNRIKKIKSKRKFSLYNNLKIPSTILTKKYFNRKKDKINIDRRVSFIRKLKFRPTAKIQNLKFHISDEQREMKKNRNMTKENLIFRTEEIKNKMKNKLKTIEEILFFLIKENNFREFKDIQERFQVDLESRNKSNDTFLIFASKCEKEDFIEYLIKKGAFINAQNNDLNTPLHYSLNNKNFKISDMLLRAGADEKILNKINLSPWEFMDYNL